MIHQPIFTALFLAPKLKEFKFSSVTNLRQKITVLHDFIEEIKSGKIETLKEEEIKSRFLETIFGKVLGFNSDNSEYWLLREEKKSTTDGTKPDGVLGYFWKAKELDDVRAVIEVKDANTLLDEKQNRSGLRTPIDQAFEYAPKMPGDCKWVIVTNLKEIRIYPFQQRSKYQVYLITELLVENKLKEFLFLFHKDRFIKKNGQSPTDILYQHSRKESKQIDKPIHIIDQIFESLQRFEGLGFVDPNHIAAIRPFNILKDHVWHYKEGKLFTLNNEIFLLLKEVTVEDRKVKISDQLREELEAQMIFEAVDKLEWSFRFLNRCYINEISAIRNHELVILRNSKNAFGFSYRHPFHFEEGRDGITRNIEVLTGDVCDCLSCNLRSFDFIKIISKLNKVIGKEESATLEYGYGHYLVATDDYKAAYRLYTTIAQKTKGKQGKGVTYFLAKLNTRNLYNLVISDEEDTAEIKNDILSIDLDKVLYDEIEFEVDRDVVHFLIAIKEDRFISRIEDEIEDTIAKIGKRRKEYERGSRSRPNPNLSFALFTSYMLLYRYINANYIVYDIFNRYKRITAKVFEGLLVSHQSSEHEEHRFHDFILTETILHAERNSLKEILLEVQTIKVEEGACRKLLEKLNNFLSSFFELTLFGTPVERPLMMGQLINYRFQTNYTIIFSNFFLLLAKLDITEEEFGTCKNTLVHFLQVENILAWNDLEPLARFIEQKGDLFKSTELGELLKMAIERSKYGYVKYGPLLKAIPIAFQFHFPSYRFVSQKFIDKAMLNASSDDTEEIGSTEDLLAIVSICKEEGQRKIFAEIEKKLDKNFDAHFYNKLLFIKDFNWDQKDYFAQYTTYINNYKNAEHYRYGEKGMTGTIFINFIIAVCERQIDVTREEFQIIVPINDFESWLLNLQGFDYSKFDPQWLLEADFPSILKKIVGNERIKAAVDKALKIQFNPKLAEIRHQYF